jgi:N-formylglutamate deformylase
MNEPFHIISPKGQRVPIVISVPHCGVKFPSELKNSYHKDLMQQPDDTDWFVHQLYEFASELGITIIHAKYSRWVIDLNRDPESAPLYNDGRIITGLTTLTDFFGKDIYIDKEHTPNKKEVDRRLKEYYWPYYNKVEGLLADLKTEFDDVLLWDAHSIRQSVKTIRRDNFPDLILGNNNEKTAHQNLISVTLSGLKESGHIVTHNTPFKGGHITRYFGKPENGIHALQLEMVKKLYMEDDELIFSEDRANKMRKMLIPIFENLIKSLNHL